ncbi:MAG: biopolymer transporter ExbD [Caulobacteraceae bacterium]
MGAKLGGGKADKFDLGQNSEINVTPFVDVMLVLLIIFMVAAPMATVSIKIDLPPAVAPPPDQKEKDPTFISIQEGGAIFVSVTKDTLKPSTLQTLAADVAASLAVANPTNERVFIRADRHVKYREFMSVINALQRAGYYKIGLINEDLSG